MEHLFREQELAGKAQYNMGVKTGKAEAGRVPGNAKEATVCRKGEPERRADLSRVEALRLIPELREALAK